MNTHKTVTFVALGLMFLSGALFIFSSGALSAGRAPAFELQMSFDGSEVRAHASEGLFYGLSFTISPEHPGPVFVSEHGVGVQSESTNAKSFCFSMTLVGDELVFKSVHGTTWTELSYSCGGAVPCRFTLTEFGVRGR